MVYDLQFLTEGHFVHHSSDFHASDEHRGVRTYTVYLSWLQILTIMTSLYLFNGVYDNAMAKYEKQRDEYTSAMQGLTLVITGAVFCIVLFYVGFLGEDFKSAEIHDFVDVSGSAAESGAFLLVGAAAV